MPLLKSKSKEAVGKNIKAEEAAGKPHKQALAIALSVQRAAKKKKKMAEGGEVESPKTQKMEFSDREADHITIYDHKDKDEQEGMDAIKKENYADGGMVDLDELSEEDPNEYYRLNQMAADHEQYDDSQLEHQPEDSNEHGHPMEDKHDRIAAIRRKMKK